MDTTDKSVHPANGRMLDMLSAWLLSSKEVFESEAQDIGQQTEASNRYLMVVVDKASKFLFASPLPTNNEELGVAVALLDVLLTFGLMISLCSHPGTEVTAEVVGDLCQWLSLCIHYDPEDPARVQGISERLGGWLDEALGELCKTWSRRWDENVPAAVLIDRTTPDPRLHGNATSF